MQFFFQKAFLLLLASGEKICPIDLLFFGWDRRVDVGNVNLSKVFFLIEKMEKSSCFCKS